MTDVGDWAGFFTALTGASAALAGLLFVGLSLNMTRILATRSLPDRGLRALVLLVAILLLSALYLVPGQTDLALGIEVGVVGGATWAGTAVLSRRSEAGAETPYPRGIHAESLLIHLATLLYVAAGALVALGYGFGTELVVPGALASIVFAMLDAWVLLVEINR